MGDYKRILVTTDFSEQALAGVETAAGLARALGARLSLLYVVEDRLPPLLAAVGDRDRILAEHREHAETSLAEYADRHLAELDAATEVRTGAPHEEIVAASADADLVVIATHGWGSVGSAVFGSTAERVIRRAACPVVTVRSRD